MDRKIALALVLTAALAASLPVFAKPAATAKPAASLRGLDWVKGSPVTFQPGRVYVIEFWATWCPPCKASIPHLTELQQRYNDKNVTVIGISNESAATVRPFVEKMGEKMHYTVAADPTQQVHKGYMNAYGAQGIPHAFIVNGDGKVVWNGHPVGEMDAVLERVVAGDFDPVAFARQQAEEAARLKKLQQLYGDYFRTIQADGPGKKSRQIAQTLMQDAPADALVSLSWDILTRLEPARRELDTALAAAEKANALTAGQDPVVLDTYALALFENGRFDEAVDRQQQAIDRLVDNPEARKMLTETLRKYKAAAQKAAAAQNTP